MENYFKSFFSNTWHFWGLGRAENGHRRANRKCFSLIHRNLGNIYPFSWKMVRIYVPTYYSAIPTNHELKVLKLVLDIFK